MVFLVPPPLTLSCWVNIPTLTIRKEASLSQLKEAEAS
jgi:hypothetical protein